MKKNKGFTLIELLIVIAIIAIIAAIVFVALDPLKRFQDSRDSRRAADIQNLLTAIKVSQVDNGGSYITEISSLTEGDIYMIGTDSTGAQDNDCDTDPTSDNSFVDLTALVTAGKLGSIPVSPEGASLWTGDITGYTLQTASAGIITIRSCESEGADEIVLSR